MHQQQLPTQRLQDVKACSEQRSLRMTNFQMHTECISTFKRTNNSHIHSFDKSRLSSVSQTKTLMHTEHAH